MSRKQSAWFLNRNRDLEKCQFHFRSLSWVIAISYLEFVKCFKYLGHMITDALDDDLDIQRKIRNLFTRTNILARRFGKCSTHVKITLFKAYCVCLYDAGLWSKYSGGMFSKLMSCYHKCIKFFFGFKRRDSVTRILFELGLRSFNTIIHNSSVILSLSRHRSYNLIICHLNDICTIWYLNLLHVSFFYFLAFGYVCLHMLLRCLPLCCVYVC